MHQYNQTRRVPQLHAGVGGMAGLQTEVAQLQNGDVVRLQKTPEITHGNASAAKSLRVHRFYF